MKKLLALLLAVGFTGAVMAQQAQPKAPTTEQKQEQKQEHKKEEKKAKEKGHEKEHKKEEKKEAAPAEQKK